MLERAASRLETAGRRFLQDSNGAIRSSRTLSRHFWKHNGSVGDTDRWYLALVPPPTYPVSEQSLGSKASNDAVLPFLDFLYPRETQQYANLRQPRSQKRLGLRRRKRALNSFQRTYTSEASNIPQNSINIPEQHWELKETEQTKAAVQAEQDLVELLQTTERTDILFDKAWVLYLAASKPQGVRSALIGYLKNSQQTIDRDRAWELFEDITPESRSEQDFINITVSQLSCKKPSKLILICQQAVSRGLGNVCCKLSFVYYVNCRDWVNVQEIWVLISSELPDNQSLNLGPEFFLDDLNNLEICDDALSLGEYLSNQPYNPSLRILASHLFNRISGSVDILESASMEVLFQLLDKYKELRIFKPRRYFIMIQLLQSATRSSMVRSLMVYRHMRQLEPSLKPTEKFFNTQLRLLREHNMTDSVRFFLDESTFFHQRPSVEQFRVAMVLFSRAADVEQTSLLFDQFIACYKKPTTAKLILPLLHAHARNGDLTRTIELFNRISEEFHLELQTECWNILMAAYMSQNDMAGAFSTYSRMLKYGQKPNAATIATLMRNSAGRGDVESIQRLLIEAREHQVSVDMGMLQPIIHFYFINGRLDLAERFCYTCMSFDLEGSPMRTLNSLLMQYAFKVDYTSFYRVLAHMKNADLEADGTTYAAILLNLVLSNRADMARQTLRRLHRRDAIYATEFHYAIVLLGYLKIGNLEMVHIIFNELSERFSGSKMLSDLLKLSREFQDKSKMSQEQSTRLMEESWLKVISRFDIVTVASQFVSSNSRQAALSNNFTPWDVENGIRDHGDKAEIEQALSVFEQYVSSQSSVASSDSSYCDNVPIRIIQAMMIVYFQAGNFEKVEEFWQLTFLKTLKNAIPVDVDEILKQSHVDGDAGLASPANSKSQKNSEIKPKILSPHRYNMSRPLSIYMRTLASQNKLRKIPAVVHDIESVGFSLSTFNRATWVQLLSQSDRLTDIMHAIQMFEEVFMPNFPGWNRLRKGQGLKPQDAPRSVYMLEDRRAPEISKSFLGKAASKYWSNVSPGFMQPTYLTVIHIAAALNRIRERSISTGSDELQRLYNVGPRTMDMIAQLPYLREKVQGVLLRQRSDQSEHKARPRRTTKIGLAHEGILGRRVDTADDGLITSDMKDTLAPADIIDMQREIRRDRKLRTQRKPQASSEIGFFEQTSTRKVYMPPAQKIVYSSRITQSERAKRSKRKRRLMNGEENELTDV